MNRCTIIGIAGASGSGKSQFANELRERFQDLGSEATLLQQDSYYRDQSGLSLQQRDATNYDHPDAFEHDLLVSHLRQARTGNPIRVPQYDYSTHNRKTDTRLIERTQVLIVEGILLFHHGPLRDLLDIKVYVEVPLETCLERRIKRDRLERGRDEHSVREQFDSTVLPMYHQFVEPTRKFADIIIHGSGSNEVALSMLSDHVQCRVDSSTVS